MPRSPMLCMPATPARVLLCPDVALIRAKVKQPPSFLATIRHVGCS